MGNISITKEFTWDMAHMLAGHKGLCQNVHGHTYRMQVEVKALSTNLPKEDLSSTGMVIDFQDLKTIIKDNVLEPFDHSFVYWDQSPDPLELKIAELLIENKRKVVKLSYRPTVEEIASSFFNILKQKLSNYNLDLSSIKIWETPTSFAEVRS